MALTPNLVISSISKVSDTESVSNLTDSTVYGTPNADRNTLVVGVLAFKVDENLVETSLDVQAYDPLVASTFVVENTIDGHQKFVLFITPRFSMVTSYPQYSVVYNTGNGQYYQKSSVGSTSGVDVSNPAHWTLTDLDTIYETLNTVSEPGNVDVGIKQTVLTVNSQITLGLISIQNAKENCCGECSNPKLQEKRDELWSLVYTSQVASTYELYTDGEKMMRLADSYCN